MIRYKLTKDKNKKIMKFAHHEVDLDIRSYIKQYFHGDFLWTTASDTEGYGVLLILVVKNI